MTETELNTNDKLRLREDIKISMVFGLLFSLALIICIGLIPGLMFILGNPPSDGFLTRSLFIIGLLFIPFLALSWTNILKYIDLSKSKKLVYRTSDYVVINKKDAAYILIGGDNKKKIKIDNELIPFINSSEILKIEISKLAKSLLFISHNTDNLIDKVNNDHKID